MSGGSDLLAVAAGGALGSLGRWALTLAAGGAVWATALVNLTGAFALGLVVARMAAGDHHPIWRPFVTVGVLGGWTTYSTFALDGHALAGHGLAGLLGYVLATLVLGVGAALAGMVWGDRRWSGVPLETQRVSREEL